MILAPEIMKSFQFMILGVGVLLETTASTVMVTPILISTAKDIGVVVVVARRVRFAGTSEEIACNHFAQAKLTE